MSQRTGERTRLDLTLELDESLPPILKGDPTHLRQVLINFVGNGLKFTNRGWVRISASHRQEQDGRIRLRFEVRDTGIGIPKDKQAELFKPFVQADRSITRQYGGSGLGLAISKRLVEAMGARWGWTASRAWVAASGSRSCLRREMRPLPSRPNWILQPCRPGAFFWSKTWS